jgi:glucosamine--fructose-6-phosphate aminotransferase (isomerizing)
MCGIVGFVGRGHRAMDVLIDGLRRLEYRGYDSAGVAIFDQGEIQVRRALGKLANLEGILRDKPVGGQMGIGHTRWATHGKPSERNAHPHRAGGVVVVHNGIIENYRKLRQEFEAAGRTMASDTDTELIAHLIDVEVAAGKDLLAASRAACGRLEGSYAFAVLSTTAPDYIVAAKSGGSPIILGLGEKQTFLASDIPAILPYTRQMVFLEDGDFAVLSRTACRSSTSRGDPSSASPSRSSGIRFRLRRAATTASCRRRSSNSRARSWTRSGRAWSNPSPTSTSTESTFRAAAPIASDA